MKGNCKLGDACCFNHVDQAEADRQNKAKAEAKAKAKAKAKAAPANGLAMPVNPAI